MSANRRVGVEVFASAGQAKTELAATKAGIAGIKAEAQTAGPAASAAMNGVGTSARATAAALGGTSAAMGGVSQAARTTTQSIAAYDKEILDARNQLAQLGQQLVDAKQRFGANSDQAALLKTEITQVSAATRGLVAEKAILIAESKVEEAAVVASTSAFSRKTSMINTGQGALRGYDAAITGVIRSMGGINLGFAVGISLLAALLPKIISLISAKEEMIKIDKDQIDTDLRRNNNGERTTRIHADLITAFRILASQQKDYQQTTKQLNHDLEELAKGSETRLIIDAKTGASWQQLNRNATELRSGVAQLNEKMGDQEKVIQPALEVILRHKEATGESTEATLEWANTLGHFAPEQIQFFRERLNALIPDIDEFTKKLNDLAVPRFDAASSLPGLGSLRASVEATFQLARDQGITDWAEQVKFATPALKALDEGLKDYTGSLRGYKREMAALQDGERAAIALMQQQQRVREEDFKARKQIRDIGPELERELIQAQTKLAKDDFAKREQLIRDEFAFRRREYEKHAALTGTQIDALKTLELAAIQIVRNERLEAQMEESRDRAKTLAHGRESRAREIAEWGAHYRKQRQVREDEERKFFADQAKIEFAARSNRGGRREIEAGIKAGQADELRRVQQVFGDLNRESATFQAHLKAIDAFSKQQNFLSGLKDALGGVINTFDLAQAAGLSFANGLQVAFDLAINEGANFAEVFGKTVLAGILSAIGQQAIAEGTYHILAGIAKLFNPFTAAQGAHEIAAGVALVAFGAALVAGASAITSSINKGNNAASGSSGAASSGAGAGATGSTQREPKQPINVVVPSFPRQRVPDIHFDTQQTADLVIRTLESKGVVTVRSSREQHNVPLRKALKTKG
ncbi:MAG: hypothetical protein AABN33_18465 [Acidobacteriota bacterium]